MPWSGVAPNQTFTRTDGTRTGTQVWQEADGAGVDIVAPDHDVHDQDLADGIASALKKDGGNQPTANLPMAGYKHTGVGDASAKDQYATVKQHASDAGAYCSVGGTANAITLTTGFSLSSIPVGSRLTFKAASTNTSAVTVEVDGLTAVAVVRNGDGAALSQGEIRADAFYTIRRDSSNYKLTSGTATAGSADVYARITPVGTVIPWPTATIPAGWLECDGSDVSRTTYAELYAAIGTTYGVGNGTTTFNIPDYRGVFLRGHANGSANDPDRATRTNRGDGTTGDAVGTAQADATRAHSHTVSVSGTTSTDGAHAHSVAEAQGSTFVQNNEADTSVFNSNSTVSTSTNGSHSHSVTATGTAAATTGNETRPINKAVKWIILANPAAASASGLGLAGFAYTWDSGTTDADPGTGKLRWNNASASSATAIYVSETDGYSADLGAVLQSLPINTRLHIFKVGSPGTYAQWSMGATATDAGDYDKLLSLTYIGGDGTFANGDSIAVVPFFAGATGSTGAAGSDGGIRWTFDSSTTMADPGTGEFRVNNATYASITALAFSALTGEATNPDFSDQITTWDDSTTTSDRGQITLRNAAGTAQVVLSVTGAITDNSTWLEIPVAHVASSGTLSGTVYVSFSRTGNAGAGSGDVSAGSNFGTDNRVIRSDGTLKGVQASGITVDDSDNVSGVVALTMTSALTMSEIAAPSTPASGKVVIYPKSDGKLYIKDDAGTETDLSSSGGSGSPSVPQGRLTLSTGVPVMTTSVTGATTIYYTPYVGRYVPLYNGTTWTMTDIGGELSQTTSDSTKSPAAVTTNSNYDLFVWSDSGTYRCTRGPAWSSDTSRGTGAGTTELERVNGILVNKIAITNGPAAQRGTYVGTVRTNGSSQCDFIFPTIATTPVAGAFNVWNMYHRRTVIGTLGDSTATWTYNSTTWREIAGNTTARCAFVIGIEEDAVDCKMTGFSTSASTGDFALLGFGVDSTSAQSGVAGSHVNTASNSSPNSTAYYASTFLGYHYIAMIERVTAAQTATIFGQSVSTQVTAAVYTLQM